MFCWRERGWRWGGGGAQGGRQSRVWRRAARSARPCIEARPSIVPARLFQKFLHFFGRKKNWHVCVYSKELSLNIKSQCMNSTLKVIFFVKSQDRRDPLRKSLEWNRKLGRKKCFVCLFEDAVESWYVCVDQFKLKYLIYQILIFFHILFYYSIELN